MPMVDVINLACGGHAGDPVTMRRTVAMAKQHNVKVGARMCPGMTELTSDPGFPDRLGFGRRMLAMDDEQAFAEM